MEYDNSEYWIKRGVRYYEDFRYNSDFIKQEAELVKFIKDNNINTDSMLELGCGFGRVTKLLSRHFNYSSYDAIDISPEQINRARSLCSSNINFKTANINDFVSNHKYDLIIAVELFMHIQPEHILEIFEKMLSIGKHLLHIDYFSYDYQELKGHNFNHNYLAIYDKLDVSIITKRIGRQVIFYTLEH